MTLRVGTPGRSLHPAASGVHPESSNESANSMVADAGAVRER